MKTYKVNGVTFLNPAGSRRQTILKYLYNNYGPFVPVQLEETSVDNQTYVKVVSLDTGEQLGNISYNDFTELTEASNKYYVGSILFYKGIWSISVRQHDEPSKKTYSYAKSLSQKHSKPLPKIYDSMAYNAFIQECISDEN